MGARGRWKQGDLADSALVGAGQRWWAMIQVLIQLAPGFVRLLVRCPPSVGGRGGPGASDGAGGGRAIGARCSPARRPGLGHVVQVALGAPALAFR